MIDLAFLRVFIYSIAEIAHPKFSAKENFALLSTMTTVKRTWDKISLQRIVHARGFKANLGISLPKNDASEPSWSS